jgi:hypothetical protein
MLSMMLVSALSNAGAKLHGQSKPLMWLLGCRLRMNGAGSLKPVMSITT